MKIFVACILSTVLAITGVWGPAPAANILDQPPTDSILGQDTAVDNWDPAPTDTGCLADIELDKTVYSSENTVIQAKLPDYFWSTGQPAWDVRPIIVEIIQQDTGSIVFYTETQEVSLTINIDLHPGEYMLCAYRDTDWDTIRSFAYFSVIGPSQLLQLTGEVVADGDLETPEFCMLMGVRLEWDVSLDGGPYTLTRREEQLGDIRVFDSISDNYFMDTDSLSGGIYTYTVSNGKTTWNPIVLDLSKFPPLEYAGNRNDTVLVLRIGDPYIYSAKDRDSVSKLSDLTRIRAIDENNLGVVPTIINNRTMIPIATLVRQMGGAVSWDSVKRIVTIKMWDSALKQYSILEIPIGSKTIYVNNEKRTFDTPALITQNRTLVPIRQLEQLGCEVD